MIRSLLTKAAAQLDRAAVKTAVAMASRHRVSRLPHQQRLEVLESSQAFYTQAFAHDPEGFFPRATMRPELVPIADVDGVEGMELSWESVFRPLHPDVRQSYLGHHNNRRAWARLYRSGAKGRPAVVLIHGYMCGQWSLEEKLWPIQQMAAWGLDVALLILPFHAVRADLGRSTTPMFPSGDPRVTVEGFRQAVMDVRALVAFLKDSGAPDVGLMGMSLGGYTASLAATLDPHAFLVPMIPLASLADFARDTGRLSEDVSHRSQEHRHMDAAYRVVSPLSRPSLVPPERVLVIQGDGDRVTTPRQAQAIAQHFGAKTHAFHGGHVVQLGRGNAFRAVGSMLAGLGIVAPPPTRVS